MLYFAYGSNMSAARLRARVSSAEKVGLARLPGHQLRFHKVSKDGSGKCDAFYTGHAEDTAYGVLYAIRQEHLKVLDGFEGKGFGYERKRVAVIDISGRTLEAQTYVATKIDPDLRPFDWYKEHVLRGARANHLPESYVSAVEGIPSDKDSDSERRALELAVYNHAAVTGEMGGRESVR